MEAPRVKETIKAHAPLVERRGRGSSVLPTMPSRASQLPENSPTNGTPPIVLTCEIGFTTQTWDGWYSPSHVVDSERCL